MGKVTGFKEFERQDETYTSIKDRVKNYKEFTVPLSNKEITKQGSRCMDCGIPFCHSGCPLGNLIPDFNHICLLYTSPSPRDRTRSRMPSSA